MGQSTAIKFGEEQFWALNARVDALSMWDASAWEEAIDWGIPDCGTFSAYERRIATAPDFE